ncbi:2-nitropropane dioxygenase [Fusarium flagelliforme]|uniref:2-nitropropane dioxygenase n=1 Tax=Fusarium flagelliforme TaxID=2675880 RepID=UPI001E8E4C99|nr:2-nitropropane dioxygenase [Fusarium flagelliforme]KAH7174933.1 2-nitropropane dioxygenase [Fusarium flagelliforme]
MEPYKERRLRLSESFPWVEDPFISNAPMSGFATNELAVAVTMAGGLGQIGFTGSPGILHRELEEAKLKLDGTPVYDEISKVLPVGVGIIAFGGSSKAWIQVFAKYRPAMVWISFGTSDEFKSWTENIRAVSPDTKVWIQVGSVNATLETVAACTPDALVLQGTDAGGHGHKHGASIITLIPEVSDALHEKGLSNIPIIAAGGIMDKRGVAAAVALGASGIVMGTRFLACHEIEIANDVVDECLVTSDGGEATVRSRVFDDTWGQNFWPDMYDGRCLRNAVYDDVEEAGMSLQEARVGLANRSSGGMGSAFVVRDSYTIWAGTGVGMLKKREQAADIVKQIREETKDLMKHMTGII